MPRQPLYVDYLPESAQEVIGKVHRSTQPARKMLEQEGMHFEGYVDIFDAGPVLQARVSELRAVRQSELTAAALSSDAAAPGDSPTLVSNLDMKNFRMIVSAATPDAGTIALSGAELALLGATAGDQLRTLPLNARKIHHVPARRNND
jgi:arginine N-succinyltransferase